MSETLNVLTPCTRPENLAALAASLEPGRAEFDLRWFIVFDDSHPQLSGGDLPTPLLPDFARVFRWGRDQAWSAAGKGQLNYALEWVDAGWVWVLDDDNVAHPNFFSGLAALMATGGQALLFPQVHRSGFVRGVAPASVRETHIDQAQYVLDRAFIGAERFQMSYTGDGEFIERLHRRAPEAFRYGTEPLCYYNWLRHLTSAQR